MNRNRKQTPYFIGIVITAMVTNWIASSASAEAQKTAAAATDYESAIAALEQVVEEELQQGILTGLSVALIDDQQVVFAAGFGLANQEQQVLASAETIYRVGSITKTLTALAAMQLVEQGKLELDAPIQKVLPEFSIVMPFENSTPITLRQLMCHRSGMIRESPVGSYFDGSQPSMEESIASVDSCVLVNPPNTQTRYSNIGATVTGQAIAVASKSSYEQYLRENLLDPLGMNHSSWRVDDPRVRDNLAAGYMQIADGQGGFTFRKAPQFELGTVPAGNLYSDVNDMALYAKMLLAEGVCAGGRIVRPESLVQMSTPQLTENSDGFGLGFFVGHHGDQRTIRHTGAVYGFSASLVVLPKSGIAVVVLSNTDLVSGRVKRISDVAIDSMLAAKIGRAIPTVPATVAISAEQLVKFTGQFESSGLWAEIELKDEQLVANFSGQSMTVRPLGPLDFEIDGQITFRGALEFKKNEAGQIAGFHAMGQDFSKVTGDSPSIPASWKEYLGSYGPDYIPLVISERHGHLYAMTENMLDYRLTPVNATVFKMPAGMYADEYLVFERDASGRVYAVTMANMKLRRLP